MKIGDKITTNSNRTGTIDGAVTSGNKIVMDQNVADIMSVGDQITHPDGGAGRFWNVDVYIVSALNPDGDNVKEFQFSHGSGAIAAVGADAINGALDDGVTLTFANSTVEGIGIIRDSDFPEVPVYISGISSLNLTANVAQTLENAITLTFKGTSRSATITGTVKPISTGTTNYTTYLNLDNILYVTA